MRANPSADWGGRVAEDVRGRIVVAATSGEDPRAPYVGRGGTAEMLRQYGRGARGGARPNGKPRAPGAHNGTPTRKFGKGDITL